MLNPNKINTQISYLHVCMYFCYKKMLNFFSFFPVIKKFGHKNVSISFQLLFIKKDFIVFGIFCTNEYLFFLFKFFIYRLVSFNSLTVFFVVVETLK